MPRLNPDEHELAWTKATGGQGSFYLERPAVFSPAASVQDADNRSRMLWNWAPIWLPWEYSNWLEEGRSFHDTAYIGDWSGLVKVKLQGPQAHEFLSGFGSNDLSAFEPGHAIHYVQLNGDGWIAGQGVLYRVDEEEFWFTGGSGYWLYYGATQSSYDLEATLESPRQFLFSVQGPESRRVVETAVRGGLGHLRFNRWEAHDIAGWPVRIIRTGVTGEIGYELHGPAEGGNDVWSQILEIGREHGLLPIGVRAQMISHVEAGIATNDRDFVSAAVGTGGRPQITPSARSRIVGSYTSASIADLYRTPAELNWFGQVSLDTHDFVGRDALLAQRREGGPVRRLVGLDWNSEDVVAVYATLFGDQQPITTPMELPRNLVLSVDKVLAGGREVGVSTSRVYSPYFRRMISLGHLDADLTTPGTVVTVLWGENEGSQREIRATVRSLPFKPDTRRRMGQG